MLSGATLPPSARPWHTWDSIRTRYLRVKKVDYVFVGSCTNGRIEDFRAFARAVAGRRKADDVVVWLVPGSREVASRIESEGIGDALRAAGFQIRQPGCSACLAMNADKIPEGKYAVSTSNRNFEGRQGYGRGQSSPDLLSQQKPPSPDAYLHPYRHCDTIL